ncbi:MAG: hypothetical protein ACP5VR_10455 [Acidimicrobiales bacterium]
MTDVAQRLQQAGAPVGAAAAAGNAAPLPAPRDFQIVPLKGLVIVGLVLGGLVATVAVNALWSLDFFHVVSGGIWTTLDLFLGFVLGPVLGRLPLPARTELTTRLMPKLMLIMPTVVICTLAAGFQLARHVGYLYSSYPEHAWVVASFVVVAVMAVIALGLLEPANLAVLFELRKPRPNGEVIERLMRRFIVTAGITGAMQVATLVIMTRLATS